jgi:hypothetical protein
MAAPSDRASATAAALSRALYLRSWSEEVIDDLLRHVVHRASAGGAEKAGAPPDPLPDEEPDHTTWRCRVLHLRLSATRDDDADVRTRRTLEDAGDDRVDLQHLLPRCRRLP